MAHATRLVLALLALSCLPAVVLAHDVWATPVTACVDGPNGFGPYISWTLENDYFLRVTLTLRTATSLGPSGTVVNLDVNGSPGGKVSNVLQLISATGTTTITGRAVWTDGAVIDPWTKSTNLRQPAGCVLCVATNQGQPCGSQANLAVCTSNVCVGNACVNQPVTADARCPSRRGQADGLALCTQQLCVNGTCSVTQPYVDPACPTTALPAGYEPTCNQRICANNQCVTAPWYWPATTPTGTAPACPTLGNHDAQCWRSLCVPDLTQNLPYGRGVCGGEAIDLSPATCPPPVAPNGRAVNPACYVPACVPGRGLCSITFLNGTGGADAAAHLGNCPVPAQYDAQCYWPYCDANGQCAGDVLSGTDAPNYVPAWRANMACPVPASFDQQCYRPACVAGKCGGFPVTGTILEPGIIVGSCAVPDGINPQCYVPACVAGKCSGFTITGTPDAPGMLNGQTCPLPADFDPQCFIPACIDGVCKGFPITGTPDAPGMLPGQTCPLPAGLDAACFIPACVNGSCQGFPMTGTIGAPGILPGFTCPLPAGMDPQCFVPGCVNGSCEGFPITGTADAPGMLPGQTCGVPAGFDAQCYVPACIEGVCKGFPVTGTADAPGYIGIIQCPLDPAFNPACWAPFCVDGQCSGGAINAGLPCTPSADEIVAGYTEECVLYVCSSEVTSAGHCVPTLKPMNSSCEDTGMPQDGCHEGLCIKGVCVASPTHINEPCTGDGTAPACNSYVCKLDESGNGKCVTQPAEIDGPCQTDLDMCTTQACVLDPLTNVGVCTVVETVDCSKQSSNPCDPGKCEPTTGQCVSSPAPDATACTNPDDVRCGEYSCYSGNCIRMCNCGNGMIDDGETCDWGADLWCPPLRPGEAAHSDRCPNGVEPGNVGAGNRLGLNDSLDNCNQTLCVLLRTPHRGLSTAAIAGVSIAAVAGVVALALAGGLAARAVANGGGPGAGTFGGDGAAAAAVDNPLFKSAGDLSNPLFEA